MFDKRKLSIVVPIYNEEDNIPVFYSALCEVLRGIDYECEMIFVNDGSHDASADRLDELAKTDTRINVLHFTRNFGKEIATTAGIHHCSGDACLMVDADLQHPLELIPEFLGKWEQGADVVIGIREKNQGEGLIKKVGSSVFYFFMNRISDIHVTPRATDYRLIDRSVIDEFNRFTEKNRMTRALIDWLGYRRAYIPFVANARKAGKAAYSPVKLVKLALSSFVAHSLFPLKFAGYLGIFITITSGTLGFFILVEKYVLGDPLGLNFSGPAILAVINLFLIGVVLSCLGLIALYIASIHGEVINRPMYTVRKKRDGRNEL